MGKGVNTQNSMLQYINIRLLTERQSLVLSKGHSAFPHTTQMQQTTLDDFEIIRAKTWDIRIHEGTLY